MTGREAVRAIIVRDAKAAARRRVDKLGACSWGRAYFEANTVARERGCTPLERDEIARAVADGKPEKLGPTYYPPTEAGG